MADPLWLDIPFLVHVLKSMEETEKEVNVLQWSSHPAVPIGTNNLSQLFNVNVDYKINHKADICSKTFIVKTPVEDGMMRKFMESTNGYGREVWMYQGILPLMSALSGSHLAARSFDSPLENSLVLEDLRLQGYKMANRLKQLDKSHCQLALKCLARLHALSVTIHQNQPLLIQNIGQELAYRSDSPGRDMQKVFLKNSFKAMMATIKELQGCEKYVQMICEKVDSFYDTMVGIFDPNDGLNVLNHGDAWITNFLFKYNDLGKVTDIKVIDFQCCQYCSFAYDVIFFWWTSANEDVRENHQEEMFEIYRQTLNQTLQELDCNIRLSKEEFDYKIKICAPFSLQVMAVMLVVTLADPENPMDFNKLCGVDLENEHDEKFNLMKNFHSKYYKSVLTNMLQQVEKFGAFQ